MSRPGSIAAQNIVREKKVSSNARGWGEDFLALTVGLCYPELS
jgi:hypothetical protein